MGTRARRSEGKHHRTQERYRWYAIQGSDNFAVVDMEELRILMDAVHEGSEPPDRNKDPDRKVKKMTHNKCPLCGGNVWEREERYTGISGDEFRNFSVKCLKAEGFIGCPAFHGSSPDDAWANWNDPVLWHAHALACREKAAKLLRMERAALGVAAKMRDDMEDETNKQIDNWKRKAMIDLRRKIVAKALAAASDGTSREDFRAIVFLLDAVLEEIDLGGET